MTCTEIIRLLVPTKDGRMSVEVIGAQWLIVFIIFDGRICAPFQLYNVNNYHNNYGQDIH